MANTPERGALIGPGTYADIKRVIERVGGMPYGGGDYTRIPTDLSGNDAGFVSPTFRLGTFSGAWGIGQQKAVTLASDTAATVTATNLFWPGISPANTATQVQCSIARDGTAWTLINVPVATASVNVITGVALGTAGLQFTSASITVLATANASSTTIGTTAC